jgi:hypothetical protein
MILRILGAAALFLGALFGVIALLVLLPFFSNFSTSLLILAAVFGVFAYVFLAIGWQLFRPPARRRGMIEEAADEERWASVSALADGQVGGARSDGVASALVDDSTGTDLQPPTGTDLQTSVVETVGAGEGMVEEPLSGSAGVLAVDSEPIVETPSSTFSGFAPVPQGGEPHLGGDEPGSEHDARAGNGHSSERAQFKKPGPPVPERSESRR